jgi:hypothetical protein
MPRTSSPAPPYAPEFNPVEGAWSRLKRSLADLTKHNLDQLTGLVKTRLARMQYRRGLVEGFTAKTGLDLQPPYPQPLKISSVLCRKLRSRTAPACGRAAGLRAVVAEAVDVPVPPPPGAHATAPRRPCPNRSVPGTTPDHGGRRRAWDRARGAAQPAMVSCISALAACMRFSDWSKTRLCAPSKTSSSTSQMSGWAMAVSVSSRWNAGRQCR